MCTRLCYILNFLFIYFFDSTTFYNSHSSTFVNATCRARTESIYCYPKVTLLIFLLYRTQLNTFLKVFIHFFLTAPVFLIISDLLSLFSSIFCRKREINTAVFNRIAKCYVVAHGLFALRFFFCFCQRTNW